MKILFLGRNDEKRYYSSFPMKHTLLESKQLICYGVGYENYKRDCFLGIFDSRRRDIFKVIRRLYSDDQPDVILIDVCWPLHCDWENLDKVEIPKALIFDDPHFQPDERIEYIRKNKIDLVLFVYKYSIPHFKDKINCRIEWLPWSVNTSIFKDYGLDRTYDVSFLGHTNPRAYPFRTKIVETLSKHPDIKFFTKEHPGGSWNLDPKKHLIGENYARVVAQSKIFAFDTGIYNGAIAKFYEGMACNTLVAAPMPFDGEELHFKPEYNFVTIDEHNFLEKILYYLKHEHERLEIAKRGYETVRKYHTVEIRAKQLIDYLKKIAK